MKKYLLGLIGILMVFLTACGAKDLNIEVEKDLYFVKDKASTFAIRVTEEENPVEALKIEATFAMLNMDHGTIEAAFTEEGDGVYSTEVELPMAGKWEIVYTIEQDGSSTEEVMEYDVKEANGVATINGEWVTNEDLEFYRFINELHIAISQEKDKSVYEGKELEDRLAYWDEQKELIQDHNQLLTQIIRLRSIALLGVEKGHEATQEEIATEIENVRQQYEEFDVAREMIQEYGEERFWNKEEQQYELIVLSQKVQNDLITKVREENPDVNDQEVMYLAQKLYDELLVSQVGSLEIDIM